MSTKCQNMIKLKTGVTVPCGKCPNCCKRYAAGWSFRLMNEEKHSETAYFVTLTYETENVTYTKNGFKTLDKTHHRAFFKSLRKKHKTGIKYFLVGEYGSQTKRPHYHAIIFNATLENIVNIAFARGVKSGLIELDGQTPVPCKHWPHGHITIGRVTDASVGYALKYMLKKNTIKRFERDDRQIEFSAISKGIGAKYLTKQAKKYHKADLTERFALKLPDGKLSPMPRYYKEKIYNVHEMAKISYHYEKEAIKETEELIKKLGHEGYQQYLENMNKSNNRDLKIIPQFRETI